MQIGIRYASGVICGSNARAVALLCALTEVLPCFWNWFFRNLDFRSHPGLGDGIFCSHKAISCQVNQNIMYLKCLWWDKNVKVGKQDFSMIDQGAQSFPLYLSQLLVGGLNFYVRIWISDMEEKYTCSWLLNSLCNQAVLELGLDAVFFIYSLSKITKLHRRRI